MKILVADDDRDARDLMRIAFHEVVSNYTEPQKSYQLEFVTDGQELIDFLFYCRSCKKEFPDIILLDLNMPVKDGKTALKEIRENPVLKHLRVIIFTSSTSEEDKTFALNRGAQYMVKPFQYNELLMFVRTCMLKSREFGLKGQEFGTRARESGTKG